MSTTCVNLVRRVEIRQQIWLDVPNRTDPDQYARKVRRDAEAGVYDNEEWADIEVVSTHPIQYETSIEDL